MTMSADDTYTPIDCDLYSEYEVAILHRQRMRLKWQDDEGNEHTEVVMPQDLKTEEHREYLIATGTDGSPLRIRLDHIHKAATASV
jgi:Rho-binding antiterminator